MIREVFKTDNDRTRPFTIILLVSYRCLFSLWYTIDVVLWIVGGIYGLPGAMVGKVGSPAW